jgi:hypothetical protein
VSFTANVIDLGLAFKKGPEAFIPKAVGIASAAVFEIAVAPACASAAAPTAGASIVACDVAGGLVASGTEQASRTLINATSNRPS